MNYVLLISLDFLKAPFQILTLHRHIDLKSRHPQGAIDILMKCLKVKTSNNVAFLEYMNFLTEKEVHWGKDRYDIVIPPYLLRNYNS